MPYIDSSQRAQENRASAWALLIVGTLGLIAVILGIAGFLPINFGRSYMLYGVMSIFFLLLIVMGFVSLKSAKSYSKRAESEKFLQDTLLEWCRENLSADEINSRVRNYGVIPEEELYFRRVEYMKYKISQQFMNLDQTFVDTIIDEKIYDTVFGEDVQE